MPSPELRFDPSARRVLLEFARESIRNGLGGDGPLRVQASEHAPALRELRASFVTLHRRDVLRGCVGAIEACRPLAEDVARNAHGAAFQDPRFEPLLTDELADLSIHISVLSPLESMPVASREELAAALRPGRDGLVIRQQGRRATYLPSVWKSLPQADEFVRQLERKAGLAKDAWGGRVECFRYTTEEWSD